MISCYADVDEDEMRCSSYLTYMDRKMIYNKVGRLKHALVGAFQEKVGYETSNGPQHPHILVSTRQSGFV